MLRPSIFGQKGYDLMNYFHALDKNFFDETEGFFSGFKTDVIDKGDHYELQAELPGFEKEDIKIDINGDYLTISAEHKDELKEEKHKYVKQERHYGFYQRSFHIANVNINGIEAAYHNGVLMLTMPKLTEEIPTERRIEIK